jgi:16S rRNA (guanine527-N7)-methyltransferase
MASRVILQDTQKKVIFDFGSGNGFPGLVLGLLAPDRQIVLVESDVRKAEFLKHLVSRLDLPNIKVVKMRVEDLKPGSIEVAVSRGFASITKAILNYRHLFPAGGKFYHLKGDHWATEVAAIPTQLCSVWKPGLVGSYSLPVGGFNLSVVVTEKIEEK